MPRLALHVAVALITCLLGSCAAGLWKAVGTGRPAETPPPFEQTAGPAGAPGGSAELEILELMRQYAAAQTRLDASFFEQAEADSYTVHLRGGGTLNKTQAIEGMKSWGGRTRFSHEDLRVQLHGDVAVVASWMTATDMGEPAYRARWKSIYLLAKRAGRWQVLSVTQVN